MRAFATPSSETYAETLVEYLSTGSEAALYRASLLSRAFVEQGTGPEEIVALHADALAQATRDHGYREQAHARSEAHTFLLEVMIAYGIQYQQHTEMRLAAQTAEAEARAAADRERVAAAERADREKTDLIAVIAHELGQPLTAVKAYVDLTVRCLARGDATRVPKLLGLAQGAVARLARLTADLLESSRGESVALSMSRIDCTDVVEQACAWIRHTAETKGLQLDCARSETPLPVRGNADALLSIVSNLLSNAVRYTPAGGRVAVRQLMDPPWAVIEVSDTGIGIAADEQAHVYEKFYRTDAVKRFDRQGLGLGLSLVQQLVAQHEGRIELSSTPGTGSTFRVYLPIASGTKRLAPRRSTT